MKLTLVSEAATGSVFFKKGVLKISAKFTGIHLCQKSLFFNEVACLHVFNFIKKILQHRCFPVNIAKFLRIAFL